MKKEFEEEGTMLNKANKIMEVKGMNNRALVIKGTFPVINPLNSEEHIIPFEKSFTTDEAITAVIIVATGLIGYFSLGGSIEIVNKKPTFTPPKNIKAVALKQFKGATKA